MITDFPPGQPTARKNKRVQKNSVLIDLAAFFGNDTPLLIARTWEILVNFGDISEMGNTSAREVRKEISNGIDLFRILRRTVCGVFSGSRDF